MSLGWPEQGITRHVGGWDLSFSIALGKSESDLDPDDITDGNHDSVEHFNLAFPGGSDSRRTTKQSTEIESKYS